MNYAIRFSTKKSIKSVYNRVNSYASYSQSDMTTDINYDTAKERIKDFLSGFYLEDEDGGKTFPYTEQIESIAQRTQVPFYIDQEHVYEHDPELYEWINGNTQRYRNLFYEVVDGMIADILGDNEPPVRDALDAFIFQRLYADRKQKQLNGDMVEREDVRKMYPPELMRRYELYFKARAVLKPMSVRELRAQYVGKLVSVSGVVIRCTEVKPLASVITYSCDSCGSETYQQVTGTSYTPAFSCPSKECLESKANGRLLMQVRGSKFTKFQEIRVQELSSQVPVGSIPTAMTIYLTGDNTRKVLPGDTVTISGVPIPLLRSGFREMAGGLITDVFLDAHYVDNTRNDEDDLADMEMTDEELELFSEDDLYERLAYSIAPEIYGHLDVKKSLLLALVGGVDKNANGMRIRGALNIILMGDPGVAKSQLLSYVDRLAFRSQYTTGRGSSGVGLTAAVIKDPVTGEMALEGGALVLADRGICCIDEFDKMMDGDRTAIHEVMEQQTISIAKAGIMTSLNARVTIIAAANPAFGRYNPKRSVEENIQLPAALLSRFDLLWLIQDIPNRETDKRIAEHITYIHRKGEQPQSNFKAIDMMLIRKYIALCKRKQPIIPEPLKQKLVDEYVKLRKQALNQRNSLYTSPRILLGAIRLATAKARLRLADIVNVDDVNEALRLMRASKDSLQTHAPANEKPRNPIDLAFDVIRDLLISNNRQPILIDDVFNKCNQRGLDDDVVNSCIGHYENLGTLQRDSTQKFLQSVLN